MADYMTTRSKKRARPNDDVLDPAPVAAQSDPTAAQSDPAAARSEPTTAAQSEVTVSPAEMPEANTPAQAKLQERLVAAISAGSTKQCEETLAEGAKADGHLVVDYGFMQISKPMLCYAADLANVEICELLLAHGADVNAACFGTGCTPLLSALGAMCSKTVALLLKRGADVNHRVNSGWTPLTAAITYGDVELVRVLLDHDATDVNAAHAELGYTPLMLAAMFGSVAIAELLLERGRDRIDFAATDKEGLDAMTYCKVAGQPHMLKLLVNAGAKSSPLLKHIGEDHGFCTPCADDFF